MQVISYAQPIHANARLRERNILVGCGILLIMLGVAAGIFATFLTMRPLFMVPVATPQLYRHAPPVIAALCACAGLILTGVGSIRLRRWSRAVVVSVAGVLLAGGAVTLIVLAVLHVTAPPAMTTLQQAGGWKLRGRPPPPPAAIDDSSIVLMTGALMLLLLAVPLFFFLVYRSPRIAGALAEADRPRSWVDGRPLPAIALAVMLAMIGAVIFLALFAFPPIPAAFASAETSETRVILGGAMIVLSVFFAWSAWLVLRLHPLGPWLALLLIGLSAGVAIAAMTSVPLRDSFGQAVVDYSPYEITWRLQLASFRGLFAVAAYAIPAAIFVLYVRRILSEMPGAATTERLPR
jgi:hypothetical protein